MENFDWKLEILQWTEKKRKIKPFQFELIEFFELAFKHTSIPEKALFGTNNYSVSLLTGGIFFAAYTKNGEVWLLLDKPFYDVPNSKIMVVKSTKNFKEPLYWLETESLDNLKVIKESQEIWESFKIATERIYESKMVTSFKDNVAKNKVPLINFYSIQAEHLYLKSILEIEKEFEEKVILAKKLSRKERQEILSKADPKPTKIIVKQTVFNRNQYVIVEVLERANGICERCLKSAPFLRDNGNSPYLEVHHKKPLAEDGDDTIENAVALCPNCHRHAHYGKISY